MLLFHTLKHSFVSLLSQMLLKHCSDNYTTHKTVVTVKFKNGFGIESVDTQALEVISLSISQKCIVFKNYQEKLKLALY